MINLVKPVAIITNTILFPNQSASIEPEAKVTGHRVDQSQNSRRYVEFVQNLTFNQIDVESTMLFRNLKESTRKYCNIIRYPPL